MLLDMTISVIDKLGKELEKAEPEKKEQFKQAVLDLLEILAKTLKDGPKV